MAVHPRVNTWLSPTGDKEDEGFRYLDGERKAAHLSIHSSLHLPIQTNTVFGTELEMREKELRVCGRAGKKRMK